MQSFLRHRALTFFTVLAAAFGLGAALIACAQPLSTGQGLLIALAVAVVLALAAVTLLRHLYFGFHSSILLLPEELADELTPLSPIGQTRILAERYVKEHTELRCLANERFLSRLLDDNSHTHAIENIDERLRAILCKQFGYRYSTFCLVSIRVEDYDAYLLKNCNGHLLLDNFRRIYEAEEHAFTARLSQKHIAYSVEVRQSCVILVNLAGSTPDTPRSELEAMIDHICDDCRSVAARFAETFNISPEVVVSAPFQDPREIHTIFEWMQTAKEYSDFLYGARDVLGPREFDAMRAVPGPLSPAMERAYYSAILSEDFSRAEQALLDLTQYATESFSYRVPQLKALVVSLLHAAEDVATSNTRSPENVGATEWEEHVRSCETIEALCAAIHEFFAFLTSHAGLRLHESASTAGKIVAFLDANYTDPTLSVTMLADSLSLSPSYISRIFKKETGQSVPDYIHGKRLQKAKELLARTELPIGDVAEQVGYSTAWTMNRVFKRAVQMTPGAYRQFVRSNQEAAR